MVDNKVMRSLEKMCCLLIASYQLKKVIDTGSDGQDYHFLTTYSQRENHEAYFPSSSRHCLLCFR